MDNSVAFGARFWGEHGLAILVESAVGRVLLDTGATPEVLLHNLHAAELPLESISAVVLSHAHRDHTGGLAALLGQRSDLPVYAHPDIWRERFSRRRGRVRAVGLTEDVAELLRRAGPCLDAEPQEVLPGVWTSGEVSERPGVEADDVHLQVREGDAWVPDPCRDDMSVVVECAQGLVLVCGCCHAGLLNTMRHVRQTFGRTLVAVVGGTHLIAAGEERLRHTIENLRQFGPPALHLSHCTGQAAYVALAGALGRQVAPFPAGTTLEFGAR
ncbi:MAG: MBL fold metallo-hydrolase [Anaerolineae bacterium]|nr:MBL fold metallo-hydrolase [Anaerolineae bacterium]